MGTVGRRIPVILGVLLLFALVGAVAALTAEGCVWRDVNNNGLKDATEACEPGWTLHATVKDNTGSVIQDGDFTTNTAGTSGKFSYTIPSATAGTWSCIISEVPPDGFVVVVPSGSGKPVTYSYTKTYTSKQGTTPVAGYSFGNKQVVASAEGCFWTDLNGDKTKQDTELCETGRILHATVTDDTNAIVNDVDFTTNALGSDGLKFSYLLPVPPTGKIWTCTISEPVAPDGYVVVVPGGSNPGYSKTYSAVNPRIAGFSFGNKEVVPGTTITPLVQAGIPFDSNKYRRNTLKSDPMIFQANWDGTGQVYISGDVASLTGVYADDGFTIAIQPSGALFDAPEHFAEQHPVVELTSGMTPGFNTFTLVVQNWMGLSMSYGSISGTGVDQTPYIIQINSPTKRALMAQTSVMKAKFIGNETQEDTG